MSAPAKDPAAKGPEFRPKPPNLGDTSVEIPRVRFPRHATVDRQRKVAYHAVHGGWLGRIAAWFGLTRGR